MRANNRVGSPATGNFTSKVATLTTDRVCLALTPCDYLTTYRNPLTPNARADYVCIPFETIDDYKYEITAPTETTDRVLVPPLLSKSH